MKGKIVLGIEIVIIAVLIQLLFFSGGNAKDKITEAFHNSPMYVVQTEIEAAGSYGKFYLNEDTKKNILSKIAGEIGLNTDYEISTERLSDRSETILKKESKNGNTKIRIVSLENHVEENVIEVEQYIFVDLVLYQNIENAFGYRDLIETAMEEIGVEAEITMNFNGEYDGKLELEERNQIADSILKILKARVTAENRTEEVYSIYAYTNLIDDYITVNKEKVNVNVAMYYDEGRDRTCLYLSTPVYNSDF